MTISLRVAGTAITNTITPNPSTGAGLVASDLSVLWVTARPIATKKASDIVITTPTNWNKVGQWASDAVVSPTPPGAGNTGSVMIAAYVRVGAAASTAIGTIAMTNVSVTSAVINTYATSVGNGWIYSAQTQGIDLTVTGFSSSQSQATTNISVTTGDWLLGAAVLKTGALSSPTVTATSATLTGGTFRQNTASTVASPLATIGMAVYDASVTAGTSTVGPVMASSTDTQGTAVFIRLRDATLVLSSDESVVATDKASDVPALRYWQNGQVVYAADMNYKVRDAFKWHLGTTRPALRVRQTTSLTIPAASVEVKMTWDSAETQVGALTWYPGGAQIVANEPGVYTGSYKITFNGVVTPGYALIGKIYHFRGQSIVDTVTNRQPDMAVSTALTQTGYPFTLYMRAGDYLEFRVSATYASGSGITQMGVGIEAQPYLNIGWSAKWEG